MKKNHILRIILAVLFGAWLTFSSQTFIPIILFLLIIFFVWNKMQHKERRFFIIVLIIALSLRILILSFYYHFYLLPGNADIFGPDGESYQCRGWYISRFLVEKNIYTIPSTEQIFRGYRSMIDYYQEKIPPWDEYQVGIFGYLIASSYAAAGYAPLLVKLSNCIFSLLTGLLVFSIAKEIFNQQVGKISMIVFLFLPSVVIVSITALKDTVILFLSMIIVWSLIKIRKSFGFRYLLIMLLSLFIVSYLRKFIGPVFLILIASSLLIYLRTSIFKKILLILLISVFIFSFPATKEIMKRNLKMETLTNLHVGFINTPGGHNYQIFPEYYYRTREMSRKDFFLGWLKGVFHFLFEPLPWNIKSKFELLSFLQNFLWYFLFAFALVGIVVAMRYRFLECIPAIIYVFIFTMAFALSEGNVGTAFRHRDSLNSIFIIFGIAGLMNLIGKLRLSKT